MGFGLLVIFSDRSVGLAFLYFLNIHQFTTSTKTGTRKGIMCEMC